MTLIIVHCDTRPNRAGIHDAMNPSAMHTALNRRSFAAAVLTAGYSTAALAADPGTKQPTAPPKSQADPQPITKDDVPAPPVKVAAEDLLLLALLRRYPMSGLTEERALGLTHGLRRNMELGDSLRQVGLANSDEPATVFRALR